jgi:hypothetical protein
VEPLAAIVCPDFPQCEVTLNVSIQENGDAMRKYALTSTSAVVVACLILLHFPVDRLIAAAPSPNSVQITAGPELESATDTLAIIRWTTTNPGGTDLHYGIVHYGTDAGDLSEAAKSPNRRNRSNPGMIFRVRVAGLHSQTTYYYTVESTGSTGMNDGVSSSIKMFRTK